jgi:gliding motility-associated-like protein
MKSLITIFLLSILSITAFAAPGDDCSTSILVSSNGCSAAGAYNNTGIIGTLAPPVCFGGGANNGMWFKFIAGGPVVNITVNGSTLTSPMVGLFSSTGACVSPFTELGCSNPGTATATLLYSALTPGNTYYIYIDGANNGVGTFQLCLSSPAQPSNDNMCNAYALPVNNFCSPANAYTNVGATADMTSGATIYPPSCWTDLLGANNGVWFSFVPTNIAVDISVVGLQGALISVVQPPAGDCNSTAYASFFQRACAQMTSGTTTTLSSQYFIPGQTYWILVDGYMNNTGSFQICINSYSPSVTVINDDCTGAVKLCPGNSYHGTTFGATNANDFTTAPWNCNGDANNVIWYSFVATNPVQPVTLNITNTTDYVQFEVFDFTGGGSPCASSAIDAPWNSIGCTNGSSVPQTVTIPAASMVANKTYYLLIDNLPSSPLSLDFNITGNQGANAGADQTVCLNASAFTLTGFSPAAGGSWSGPGVTSAGVFTPSSAGIGTHVLYYSYGPCADSKIIKVTGPTVNVSNNVSICPGACTTLLGDATMPQVITTSPSFSASPNAVISTVGTSTTTSIINVSGLSVASLSSICLNINHTYDSDLSIYLICPSGTTLTLSSGNGSSNNNYTGTCFNTTSGTNITSGAAPFNLAAGYLPQGGSLNSLSGCLMNGNWIMQVIDGSSGDGGTFLNWTLNFTNNVTNTIPATSFVWSPAGGMTGGATLSPTVCPASTTVYSLTGTDGNGCKATDAMTVTVTPLTITVTPNATICSGTSTTLTATGATSYSWTPSTGLSLTTGASVVANPTVTTTYSVTGTQGGCTNTKTVTVTVNSLTLAVVNPTFCIGSSGSLSASGASTYTWSPATGLSASTGALVTANPTITANYTVTGTSVGGCVGTQTAVVIVNPKPLAILSFTNPTCGNNNGVIYISNTSPAAPPQTISTYASSLGSVSGQTVTGLGAGTPVITLTNNFGCTFTVSTTLTMTPGPTAITTTTANATCGLNNGSFTFGTPTGGTPTYSYAINGGAFSATSPTTALAPGNYSVTVKDANGCVFIKPLVITNIPGPTAIAGTSSPATCSGTGSYTVTGVTGGTPTYSFSIDAGAYSTASVTAGLSTGTHSISVKDANGCTFPTTFNVGLTGGITSATVTPSTVSCGASNGTATVSLVTGGAPTYSYSNDGGGFVASPNITGLAAGNHTVVIKDVNTCTLSVPYTVSSLGSPTTSITSFSNVSCFGGANGSCTVAIPTGGAGGPYTYTISTTPIATNGIGTFAGLVAGTYNITVKDVAGCIATTSVTIAQPTQVVITPSSLPVKCFGTATGTINVVGSGGTPGYTYNLNGGGYQASTVFANQNAGTYIMGIKDANLCTATQTVTITQPTALAISVSSQNANCTAANGIGSATVTGGSPIYTYTWTGTGGAAATSNGLIGGNYTVTATDVNGCIISSPVTIGITLGGTASITASTNITCNGFNNGTMTAGITGGASPYTYSWSPGGQTSSTAINLAPNTYSCTITDFYGCKSTAFGTITQPSVLAPIMNSQNVKCFGTATGTISATGSGGTAPYTYLWPTLASTLSTVNNVAIGIYSCTTTDANNCSITQTIAVTQPSSITLTSTVTPANCNLADGSATISISGGSPAYTQTWSAGSTTTAQNAVFAGTYTINVKDANNCVQTLAVTIPNLSGPAISIVSQTNVSCFGTCNGAVTTSVTGGATPYIYSWSNGQVTASGTNLCAQVYTVSVTDNNGCIASTSVNITQPTALSLTVSPTNPKCFGAINGYGIAAAIGGSPGYTYAWTGGGGSAATSSLLGAGNYGISVTDAKGCIVTSTMALINPPAMSASISSTNVTCFNACNATAIATSTNGVGAVSYYWTGGSSPITAQTATGLCAGTYTMVATDQNNCTGSSIVTITQPTQITANITSSGSVTCNGGNNGFASVTPGGGTGAYSYTWTPSGGNGATANTLIAGNYVVAVKDVNLCTATASVTILQPSPLATTLTTTNVKCNGASDGTANVAFAGGAGTTTFLWQPGLQSGNSVNNLSVGNQTVTITSNGACPTILTFTLTEPAALTAVVSTTNSNCGQANGKACATVGGGTAPLFYQWSNGPTTLCNNNVVSGAYTFTVTDANLCTKAASGLINDIAGPSVAVTSTTAIKCFGQSNGAATTTITGGVTPYNINWSGNSTTVQNVTNFNAGLHNITVTDAAGCVGTASVNITQPPALTSAIGSFSNVTCAGFTNGQATMLVNGGTPNYSYSWIPSAQTSSVMINVGANTYTCIVTDVNLCSTSQVVTISQPAPLVMISSSFTNVSCFGGSNGQIITNVSGGTPGLTYSWSPTQTNSGVVGGLIQGPYSLVVTDVNNCSISANFTIVEPSVLTATATSLPAKCGIANGSATTTAGGGNGGYSYTWNTATPQSGSVATNMSPGNWNCSVIDSKGCSLTQTVNVANAPSPVISGFTTTQPLCFGQLNGSIVINYTSGTPSYSVAWSNAISPVQTTSGLSQTVTGVGSGVYTATVTDSYGCNTSGFATVNPAQFLGINSSAVQTICYGQSAQIYAAGFGGVTSSPYTYTWTPAMGSSGGPLTVSPTVNSFYTVTMSDVNGCTTSPVIITVNVTPSLSVTGYAITKCDGELVTLSPIFTSPGNGGVPQYNYSWSNGATTNSITVNASYITTPNMYTVTVSDCTIPSASGMFTVNANPLPIISFTSNILQGCAPLTVTLTGTSTGANDVFTWEELGTPGNPKVVTFSESGLHTVILSVTNPLTGCSARETKTDYINVYPIPTAEFYAVPAVASILFPYISFTNTSVGAVSYIWDFGDVAALNGTNNSTFVNTNHSYLYTGNYNVTLLVTSIYGCTDLVTHPIEITPDFALYIPNCFTPDANGKNDMFQPLGVGIDEDNYRMDIFDRWGENIFTSNNFRKGWDGTVKGSTKTAPQGVYIYKLQVFDLQGGKHPFVGHVTVLRETQ